MSERHDGTVSQVIATCTRATGSVPLHVRRERRVPATPGCGTGKPRRAAGGAGLVSPAVENTQRALGCHGLNVITIRLLRLSRAARYYPAIPFGNHTSAPSRARNLTSVAVPPMDRHFYTEASTGASNA